MNEVTDTSPERQAYLTVTEQGYKGRFASNIANIRLFKDNPYIADLDEVDRLEENKHLLTPYHGEQFYDDESYVYICRVEKDSLTGEVVYTYTSQEKNIADKLAYYESAGVLNQMMSAYNNGKIYNFYVDRGNGMIYPNESLIFPADYAFYVVKQQSNNADATPVFVVGEEEAGGQLSVRMAMTSIQDVSTGSNYTKMSNGKIFTGDSTNVSVGRIVNGEFYVVEFYNIYGIMLSSKLFQAVDAVVTNNQLPSQNVVDISITVLRNNVPQTSGNGVYPILAGEDLSKTVSFIVRAIYSDGTIKNITDKLDTGFLQREGWDTDTTGRAQGERIPVSFTYYPYFDPNTNNTGSPITKDITFQVVAATSEVLYKIIPVMWDETASTLEGTTNTKLFRLKIYTLSTTGVLENRTRSFFDTFKVVDQYGNLIDFQGDGWSYIFDSYSQTMLFTFAQGASIAPTTFSFRVYNNSVAVYYRFAANFNVDLATVDNTKKALISEYTGSDASLFGYEVNGVLSKLGASYGSTLDSNTQQYKFNNVAVLSMLADGRYNIRIAENKGMAFATKHRRIVNGSYLVPTHMQVYGVKDSTFTPLTNLTEISVNTSVVDLRTILEQTVANIVNGINTYDCILVKFVRNENNILTTTDIDVYIASTSY